MSNILKSWSESLQGIRNRETTTAPIAEFTAGPSAEVPHSSPPPGVFMQEGRESLPLEIGDEIRRLLSPVYIQIESPLRMDATLLRPFCAGQKNIILHNPQNGIIVSASLHMIHNDYLIADTEILSNFKKGSDRILAIFPCLPKRQFVVQTVVEEVDHNRIKLCYQDPRQEGRWRLRLSPKISLRVLTAEILTAILKQQAQAVREIILSRDRVASAQRVQITDLLYAPVSSDPMSFMQRLDATPPFLCSLENFSLGGGCISLNDTPAQVEFLRQMIRIDIPVHPIELVTTTIQLDLRLLAIVRNVDKTAQSSRINLQFFRRLPQELTGIFERIQSTD